MESMLYNVYEYGLVSRWSDRESKRYRKQRSKSNRQEKHQTEEMEE
jgi:hypothetical protein